MFLFAMAKHYISHICNGTITNLLKVRYSTTIATIKAILLWRHYCSMYNQTYVYNTLTSKRKLALATNFIEHLTFFNLSIILLDLFFFSPLSLPLLKSQSEKIGYNKRRYQISKSIFTRYKRKEEYGKAEEYTEYIFRN